MKNKAFVSLGHIGPGFATRCVTMSSAHQIIIFVATHDYESYRTILTIQNMIQMMFQFS